MLLFTPGEVINFALQIEKNGQAFYRALADRAEDAEAKNVFTFMANEEASHYDTFSQLGSKLTFLEPEESYPGEYAEYMRELVESHVFTRDVNPEEMAAKVKDSVEAVNLALGFEKDSILFFHELKKLVPAEEQCTVDGLIAEEGRHVKKLLQLKKLLSGTCDR